MAGEAAVYAGLTEIFRDIFLRDDLVLTADMTAQQVDGWDSFRQIEIIMAAEERWRIKFSTREIDGLRSVGDLVRVIADKAK
ncbi:MAG: acyl carrier protein [Acetobacteraceae bacterium]